MQTIIQDTGNGDSFKLTGRIGEFLGNIERKPKGAVFMSLDAPPGAGKTRFVFQMINEFAQDGYPLRKENFRFPIVKKITKRHIVGTGHDLSFMIIFLGQRQFLGIRQIIFPI